MSFEQLLLTLLGLIMSVVIYFLKGVIDDFKSSKNEINNMKSDIRLLEQSQLNQKDYIIEKFDVLNNGMKEIQVELKTILLWISKNDKDE